MNVNTTSAVLINVEPVRVHLDRKKRSDPELHHIIANHDKSFKNYHHISKRAPPNPAQNAGISQIKIDYAINYNPSRNSNWISPSISSQIFNEADVTKVFYILLALVILGSVLSSPATGIADSANLGYLGNESDKNHGKQRVLAAFGSASVTFIVGIVLDYANFSTEEKCPKLLLVFA